MTKTHVKPTSARRPSSGKNNVYPPLIIMVVVSVASFFAGSLWTLQAGVGRAEVCGGGGGGGDKLLTSGMDLESIVEKRVKEELEKITGSQLGDDDNPKRRFPVTMRRYANGLSRTKKANFTKYIDIGVPWDKLREGEEDVLLLHATRGTIPSTSQRDAVFQGDIPELEPAKALENCDEVHVVLTDNTMRKKCVALVPQYESFHIFKFMRVSPRGGPLDHSQSLRYVSRGYQSNGREKFQPPASKHTRRLWDMLVNYLQSIDEVLEQLKVICERIAKNNTIVVMVCNFGQSELLLNFVCACKARNLDTSQILLFATDKETKELAESVGLAAFFDEKNFGDMPLEAARSYGDRKFVAMMLAKVFCVQMVSLLGYDFLFQDVDIVWYKNPLEYFHDPPGKRFDVYFQDDGAHTTRYAPYSANSGFYFVRHNERTQFFLTSILHAGDLVIKTDSHQQALIALLAEHASLYGLRVKVMSRDLEEFPGGYNYHQKSGKYMRGFFKGEIDPYIFHMSWTHNKDNKLLFWRQMGEWFLDDACIQKKLDEIEAVHSGSCCLPEPNITCHYRDKPSKFPCKDSPPIDDGRDSFWK